jgi:hypothetical protein
MDGNLGDDTFIGSVYADSVVAGAGTDTVVFAAGAWALQ